MFHISRTRSKQSEELRSDSPQLSMGAPGSRELTWAGRDGRSPSLISSVAKTKPMSQTNSPEQTPER
jgi:hypothetical protein